MSSVAAGRGRKQQQGNHVYRWEQECANRLGNVSKSKRWRLHSCMLFCTFQPLPTDLLFWTLCSVKACLYMFLLRRNKVIWEQQPFPFCRRHIFNIPVCFTLSLLSLNVCRTETVLHNLSRFSPARLVKPEHLFPAAAEMRAIAGESLWNHFQLEGGG